MTDDPKLTTTRYGFEYGSVCVERMLWDKKFGTVIRVYSVADRSKFVDVRVSPGGKRIEVSP